MALFGNKSKDPNGSAAPASAPDDSGKKGRGLSFGRKKDTATTPATTPVPAGNGAAAGGIEDFSDFSEAALVTPDAEATGKKGKVKKAKAPAPKKKIKSGTVVGLNVGNDSIKAVELKIKGDAISVTAMGMVPTPAESISNGVVMSVSSLGHAIRDLFKESGFSSRQVVSSVAGTGALVVRVIEVPQMDDKELANNMKVDADRYIPFPPSEVIMDFKALRELPTDPASGNMEVLLAAAQREIIDLHINVLQDAKLGAGAIDVEPLAAARTVAYSSGAGGNSNGNGAVDYNDVSAILNMGATGSEISVLRGDILVFTRSIPIGGHVFTQQIVDTLGLPWHDAERLKCDMGDALPPHSTTVADMPGQATYAASGAGTTAATDDWSSFSTFDEEPTAATAGTAAPDTSILDEEWPTPAAPDSGATATGTSTGSNAAADPFDLDFFSQGPRNDDPKEQHGQKEEEEEGKPVQSFDFSSFSLDDEPAAPPAATSTSDAGAEPSSAAPTTGPAPATPKPPSFNFSFPEDTPAASAVPLSATSTTEAIPDAVPTPQVSSLAGFSFDTPEPEPATPTPAPTEAGPSLTTSPTAASAGDMTEIHPATPSAYDLSDIEATGAHPVTASAVPDEALTVGATPVPAADDFDIDSLFNAGPASSTAAPTLDIGAPASVAATTPVAAAPTDDFGTSFDDFGLGLTATNAGVAGAGSDAEAVHSIIRPLLEELAGEVRRSLEYYASRYPDTVVRHVTLIGGGAKLKNVDAFFTQMLGIPSTVGNPMARLTLNAPKLPPGYADQNGPIFAVAVGLALRDVV